MYAYAVMRHANLLHVTHIVLVPMWQTSGCVVGPAHEIEVSHDPHGADQIGALANFYPTEPRRTIRGLVACMQVTEEGTCPGCLTSFMS